MELVPVGADLLSMDEDSRGQALRKRRLALKIKSQRELDKIAQEQGFDISRSAIMAAEGKGASSATYDRYDALLSHLEGIQVQAEAGGETASAEAADEGVVEYRASGDFGVEFVVKGPVGDRDALKRDLLDMLREIRGGQA